MHHKKGIGLHEEWWLNRWLRVTKLWWHVWGSGRKWHNVWGQWDDREVSIDCSTVGVSTVYYIIRPCLFSGYRVLNHVSEYILPAALNHAEQHKQWTELQLFVIVRECIFLHNTRH